MTNDDKHKSAQNKANDSHEQPTKYVPPERIPDTVDNALDKLFSTTPE